jgi:methylated-DNA-protein-cysteine methyltransferase related protein
MNDFFYKVYNIVVLIPPGKIATYGQIAAMLGNPRGARTVGWAMQSAPANMKLPCHRVVNRLGAMAPGSIFGGEEIQRVMLESEGVSFLEDGKIDMKKSIWKPEV